MNRHRAIGLIAVVAVLIVLALVVVALPVMRGSAGTASSQAPATTKAGLCEPDPACAPTSSSCAPGAAAASRSGEACAPGSSTACGSAGACSPSTGAAAPRTSIARDPALARKLSLAPGSRAADLGLRDLGAMLEEVRGRFRVPGLAAALVVNGRVTAAGVAGVRKAGAPQPIQLADRFHLGSCGKSFTALVAARLVSEGRIRWDSTVGEVFPELRETMEPAYRAVTLGQLVAHRSGFPSLERGRSPLWRAVSGLARRPGEQRQELVRRAVTLEPASMPGAAFGYTDLGYAVAGRMLERVSGSTWEDLIRSRVAAPLGLETLGFGAPGEPGAPDQPWGHEPAPKGALRAIAPGYGADGAAPAVGPAGTIHVSILDWADYARFHLEHARDRKGSNGGSLKVLYEDPYRQGYGMGWSVGDEEWARGRVLSHTGSCGAWAATIWIAPERNAAIVVTSNYGGSEGFAAAGAVARQLIDAFLEQGT